MNELGSNRQGISSPASGSRMEKKSTGNERDSGSTKKPNNSRIRMIHNDLQSMEDNSKGAGKKRLAFAETNMTKAADVNKGARPSGSYQKSTQGETKPEWYQELTEQQISMFKQLFELLDRDGGGTIDGMELYELLKDLDIGVTKDEIIGVLKDLDKDGNGEIDFDEFLYCMTETDRFLQGLEGASPDQDQSVSVKADDRKYSNRQRLFFTAITKFAIKNSMGDIERYYAAKARHVPHVIGHYTAGARLIGLTDRQLARHIAKLQKTSKGAKSPYAKPLPFVALASTKKKKRGKKSRQGQFQSVAIGPEIAGVRRDRRQAMTITTHSEDDVDVLSKLQGLAEKGNIVAKLPGVHLVPQIRQKLEKGEIDEDHPIMSTLRKRRRQSLIESDKESKDQRTRPKSVPAQMSHRVEIKDSSKTSRSLKNIEMHSWKDKRPASSNRLFHALPSLKVGIANPTIEDLPKIREKVSSVVDGFYSELCMKTMHSNWINWDELHVDEIPTKTLQKNFAMACRAYSPTQICQRMPALHLSTQSSLIPRPNSQTHDNWTTVF